MLFIGIAAVFLLALLCVYAANRAGSLTDHQDERLGERLAMQTRDWRWPEWRGE